MKKYRVWIVAIIGLLFIVGFVPAYEAIIGVKDLSYNKFMEKVEDKQIKEISYDRYDSTFIAYSKKGKIYYVSNPESDDFKEVLLKKQVKVNRKTKFNIGDYTWILTVLMLYLIYKFTKTQLNLGNDVVDVASKSDVKLKDISCPNEVKKEVKLLIDYLKRPEYYQEKHAKIPGSMLLYGPPGTGKTLLARAIAGEADCSFYAISGSDFVKLYAGNGALRVRELFKEARNNAPAIVFIDEIDAVGGVRGSNTHSENVQTINALLNELDGFDGTENILVIGATNRIESLDPALTRSGRFGKHISVPLPRTKEERMKIINLYKVDDAYDKDVDFEWFAKITREFSGADIAITMNEALLISIQEGKEKVDKECLEKAFRQHLLEGHSNKNNEISEHEQTLVAYHEAGHAIVSSLLCNETISTISIIGTTSGAGGYTISLPDKETFFLTKDDLYKKIMVLYAGRAAERISGYDVSVGATNDIEKATQILKSMYSEYAMDEEEGLLNHRILYDKEDKNDIEKIKVLSSDLYEKTKAFLVENKELLERVKDALLEKETIDDKEFLMLIDKENQ